MTCCAVLCCAVLQSAAKCPILAAFRCDLTDGLDSGAGADSNGIGDASNGEGSEGALPPATNLGGDERVQACIFKVGDDCRQDVLALQVMRLLKGAFDGAGLPLYMAPYGVVPTGHEQGIIEVIPQAKSRAQLVRGWSYWWWWGRVELGGRWGWWQGWVLVKAGQAPPLPQLTIQPVPLLLLQGEMFDGGLFEIFQHEFGLPGARRFEAARRAFLESTAAYSIASYLLWAKDRHNGNLMLDNQGHFLHIDFGYILGISPGGWGGGGQKMMHTIKICTGLHNCAATSSYMLVVLDRPATPPPAARRRQPGL